MFEECPRVGVQESGKSPDGFGGTICAVMMVPARYLALVLVATRVRDGAEDGLVTSAVAEATFAT